MIVTFCGHREGYCSAEVSAWLDVLLPALIEGGAGIFYLGGYGRFDALAASAVWRQKFFYPDVQSILVVPYLNREYDLSEYDDTLYPPLESVPLRYAISKRNDWMITNSDVVISGVTHGWGGAAKTLAVAKRKKKFVLQYPLRIGSGSSRKDAPV